MPGIYKAALTGDWGKLQTALATTAVRFPAAVHSALMEEAEFYRAHIMQGIRSQAPAGQQFKPLSRLTIAMRKMQGFRGTKALLRTGEMHNNVVAEPVGKYAVFVGILYSAVGADGRKLAEVAKIHEYGATVRVSLSRAQKRAVAAAGRMIGPRPAPSGGVAVIPARPFLQPIFSMYSGTRGAARMQARVARKMGGMLGVLGHPDLGGKDAVSAVAGLAGNKAFGKAVGTMTKGVKRSMLGSFKRSGARARASKVRIGVVKWKKGTVRKRARIRLLKKFARAKARAANPKTGATARNQKPTAGRKMKAPRLNLAMRGTARGKRGSGKTSTRKTKGSVRAAQLMARRQKIVARTKARHVKSIALAGRRVSKNIRGTGAQHNAHVKAFKAKAATEKAAARKLNAGKRQQAMHAKKQATTARKFASSIKKDARKQAVAANKMKRAKQTAARAHNRSIQATARKAMAHETGAVAMRKSLALAKRQQRSMARGIVRSERKSAAKAMKAQARIARKSQRAAVKSVKKASVKKPKKPKKDAS